MSRSKGYGTAFEKLEDEDGPIKKRPKRVHEEVVTDERGRRRFHGAFTGGFSAGYFNSVGSKHGWVPQTFKSSRQNRAKHDEARPEDFMDEEDLGEFGIASRQFKVNRRYVDDGMQGKAVWDRPSTSVAEKVDSDDSGIKVVGKAHSSSIGLLIMKKMGYREGKGVGAPLTRRQLEMQRIHEARAHGRRSRFDQTAVEEAEEFAAGFEFVPEDIPPVYFACKQDTHGLGYKGLSGLSGGYGALPIDAAPSKDKKKGHGAAFGVGVFEDSDDDVYGNDDIAAYNFALGGSQKRDDADPMAVVLSAGNVGNFDIKFLPAKRNRKKPPHLSIRVPSDFKPNYKAIAFDSSTLPSVIKSYAKNMTPLQRAMILGEKASNVMELLSENDRETLRQARRIADDKKVKSVVNRQEIEIDPYPNDEAKSFRFKTYLQCLRRGVPMTQPSGIAHLQWLAEESEFQNKVPTELRYLLPDVQQRKEPLYKGDFTPNLMNQLKSRFINQDEAAVIAAKPKPLEKFQKIEWHPSKLLCKRLKVPDPFPKSEIEGTLGSKSKNKLNMGNYEYTRTAVEKELIKQNEMSNLVGTSEKEFQSDPIPDAPLTEADPLTQFFDLMDKVYGTTAEEIKEGEKLEAQFNKPLQLPPLPRKLSPPRPIPESFAAKKQKTIFDDDLEDETKNVPVKIAFVPSSKSSNSNRSESGNKFESNRSKEEKKVPVYVVSDSDTSSDRSRKSRKKKSKKSKKERSHKKKEHESSSKKSKHKKHSRDREHKSSKKSKKHRSYSESD